MKPLPIIGMSPGNSYFKEDKISFLLNNLLEATETVAVMIADIPAISTYLALGYPENRARTDKAIRNGNNIKNRVRRVIDDENIDTHRVLIIDWEHDVETSKQYKNCYKRIRQLYDANTEFREDCNQATESVLRFSRKEIEDMGSAVSTGVHYLLSEFAFLEYACEFFSVPAVTYVYHNNWPVYERYIAGTYDDYDRRSYMQFSLLEHPTEQFIELVNDIEFDESESALTRIKRTKLLFAGYAEYENAFYIEGGEKKGIFHDLLNKITANNGWGLLWTHEVGYGAAVESLKAKRFDVFASTAWAIPERLEEALFSQSLFSSDVYSWCREGFDKAQNLRIAVKENDISHSLAKNYPEAELVFVEQLAGTPELLHMVADRRADITFVEESLAHRFNGTSDTKVTRYKDEKEETFGNSFMFRKGEDALVGFINSEIARLTESGFIDTLLKKYS